jgi:hypothetical protein
LFKMAERDALLKLRAIRTLEDYLNFTRPKGAAELRNYRSSMQLLFDIARGELDAARNIFAEDASNPIVDMMNQRRAGLGARLLEQGSLLSDDDRAELAAHAARMGGLYRQESEDRAHLGASPPPGRTNSR